MRRNASGSLLAFSIALLVLLVSGPAVASAGGGQAQAEATKAAFGDDTTTAHSSAVRCFGKPARSLNRRGIYRLRYSEAVVINAPVRIIGKGNNRICAGRGAHSSNIRLGKGAQNLVKLGAGDDVVQVQGPTRSSRIDAGGGDNRITISSKAVSHVIRTGAGNDRVIARAKANRYSVSTGAGNDSILFRPPAKSIKRKIQTGLGEDIVTIRAKGNTNAILGAKSNPQGLPDNDYYSGGASNDIVETYGGINQVYGNDGADSLSSLGTARSQVYGGNGSDKIYSSGGDHLYGNRGNDRIEADRGPSIGGVVADGGAGDDWLYGSNGDDILIGSTGVDKFKGYGGNDLFRADDGLNTIEGGTGNNTVSFAAHTPPGYQNKSGVFIDLRQGVARGSATTTMSGIQNVIGSSFDDVIHTDPRYPSEVWAGLGDDEIHAQPHDTVHPGLITDDCEDRRRRQQECTPRPPGQSPVVSLSPDGVLAVLGSRSDDSISLGRAIDGTFTVNSARPLLSAGEGCTVAAGQATCRAPELRNVLAYGGAGNDTITVEDSLPASVSTVLDGGDGNNVVRGGKTADYIYTGRGNSVLEGNGGDDVIKASETNPTVIRAGDGHDLIRVINPCLGHDLSGGAGKDNVVFAGSPHGIEVNYTRNYSRWLGHSNCAPSRMGTDLESAEGTRYNDLFVGSRKRSTSFLGRDGIDIFQVKNGRRDVVTTGSGGRRNKVIADRFDKVTYGWGFAAF